MKHSGEAEDMVAVEMADEYPRLPVDSRPSLKKLTLGSLPAIKEKEVGAPPHKDTWEIPKFVWDASAGPKKSHGN